MTEKVTTFATLIADGALQIGDGYRAKNSELNGNGLPFMRSALVQDSGINLAEAERFPEEQTQMLQPKCTRPDDVVITTKGNSTGRTAVIRSDHPIAVYSPHLSFWRVLNRTVVDPGFLRQWSRSNRCQDQIRAMMSSTDMAPYLSLGDQSRLKIGLPPLPQQLAIAGILGVLDDQIELNRKMSATLEAIARALFKSWFVDFDPVRARAEGRDPGLPAGIAALFTNSFENSEGGSIPRGWRASTLGREASRCAGSVQTGPFGSQLHAADYITDGLPVVMPQDIQRRRVSTERISRIGRSDAGRLARHRLQAGDLVYSRRGDVKKHALIGEREAGWICGTGCLLVRLGAGWPSPVFASIHLDMPDTRAWISRHAIGATMPNLNTGILSATPILVPPDPIIEAFAHLADPLNACSVLNDRESRTLAAIRDALLPKLISGELRVGEAERLLAASA